MAKVAIIGAGLIGRAWAVAFARAGHEVALTDNDATAVEKALAFADGALKDLQRYDLLEGSTPREVRGRLHAVTGLADALSGAIHVQENAPERLEVKRALYAELDRLADPAVVERTAAFMRAAGQAPIVMKREIDGFVVNRLQGALLQEAFRLVADGYASCEDVDIALREGLALRWSFMGPFETIDLNAPEGVRDYVERYAGLYEGLFESQRRRADWKGPVLEEIERQRRQHLKREDLGRRHGWRDRRLMALAAHQRAAARDITD